MDVVKLRPYQPTDENFILNSWLKIYYMSRSSGPIPQDMFAPTYRPIIRRLLTGRPEVDTTVAVTTEDDDQILGYIVHEQSMRGAVIFWCYVKQSFRRMGVATKLLNHAVGDDEYFSFVFNAPGIRYLTKHKKATYSPRYMRRKTATDETLPQETAESVCG